MAAWRFDGIDVLKGASPDIIQSLECNDNEAHGIFTADFNVDGYYDAAVIAYTGNGRNYGYCYWLFDKDSGTFKRQEKPELVCPYVDYDKQTLRTQWSGSQAHWTRYFKHIDGKWLPTSDIEVKWNLSADDGYRKIIRKRLNGKMVTISNRHIEDNEEAFSHIRRKVEQPARPDINQPFCLSPLD